MSIGRRRWAIAEGYIPAQSTSGTRQLESHETICLLNAGDEDARIEVMVYFADREPAGPGGHLKVLHLWPGQIPPPLRRRDVWTLGGLCAFGKAGG